MIDYLDFFQAIQASPLAKAKDVFRQRLDTVFSQRQNGNLPRWLEAWENLPPAKTQHLDLNQSHVSIGKKADLTPEQHQHLHRQLKNLMPWRKGPYRLFDITIDTEWRSDWKWDRLAPHIEPLKDKLVLDVGCGSGYHSWRMAGAGAKLVMGIDPSLLFALQFLAMKKYAPEVAAFVLPLALEDMPQNLPCFDTVFSMGVLYHRRSPLEHIGTLKKMLRPGGELVLETLVMEGDETTVFMPEDRYAKMRNVWFIPSVAALSRWLSRCGFHNIRCVDVNQTSVAEQRATEWMPFESLANFLDPDNPELTIEGHPAPKRAILLANK